MQDLFGSLPNTVIPVKDGLPVTYGRTIEGSVQEVTSIEEVLGNEGSVESDG